MNARGYKWVVLALLSGAFFFHQADRARFGLLTIPIQEDLGLADLQIGWVNTALFCTLAVTTPFAPAHRASAEGLMTMIAFFIGSLSPLLLGALSDRLGVRGFEIGFGILGVGYLVGVAALVTSFLFTFRRDRVVE